jgi:hypothetical protein
VIVGSRTVGSCSAGSCSSDRFCCTPNLPGHVNVAHPFGAFT